MKVDYLEKLSAENLDWLSQFNEEFHTGYFPRGRPPLHRTKKLRRDCYARNNAAQRDLYSRLSAYGKLDLNAMGVQDPPLPRSESFRPKGVTVEGLLAVALLVYHEAQGTNGSSSRPAVLDCVSDGEIEPDVLPVYSIP
jgi:hypothetical protein